MGREVGGRRRQGSGCWGRERVKEGVLWQKVVRVELRGGGERVGLIMGWMIGHVNTYHD